MQCYTTGRFLSWSPTDAPGGGSLPPSLQLGIDVQARQQPSAVREESPATLVRHAAIGRPGEGKWHLVLDMELAVPVSIQAASQLNDGCTALLSIVPPRAEEPISIAVRCSRVPAAWRHHIMGAIWVRHAATSFNTASHASNTAVLRAMALPQASHLLRRLVFSLHALAQPPVEAARAMVAAIERVAAVAAHVAEADKAAAPPHHQQPQYQPSHHHAVDHSQVTLAVLMQQVWRSLHTFRDGMRLMRSLMCHPQYGRQCVVCDTRAPMGTVYTLPHRTTAVADSAPATGTSSTSTSAPSSTRVTFAQHEEASPPSPTANTNTTGRVKPRLHRRHRHRERAAARAAAADSEGDAAVSAEAQDAAGRVVCSLCREDLWDAGWHVNSVAVQPSRLWDEDTVVESWTAHGASDASSRCP